MKTLPLSEVKNKFSRIVDAVADRDERVLVTRNGKPAALMLNPGEFERLLATLDILSDPDMMAQIRRSERNFKVGRFKRYGDRELDELLGPAT
jgi:prevent-host-death family protein